MVGLRDYSRSEVKGSVPWTVPAQPRRWSKRGWLSERMTEKKSTITLRNGDVKTVGNVGQNEKAGDDEDDVQRENVVLFIVRWRVVGRRRISG